MLNKKRPQSVHFCTPCGRFAIVSETRQEDLVVGVVLVAGHHVALGIHQLHHVALKVGDVVVVGHAVSLHGVGVSVGIVEEIHGDSALCLPQKLSAGVEVVRGGAVYLLGSPQAVGIVALGVQAVSHGSKPQEMLYPVTLLWLMLVPMIVSALGRLLHWMVAESQSCVT